MAYYLRDSRMVLHCGELVEHHVRVMPTQRWVYTLQAQSHMSGMKLR
jgi:hypothetical protein